MAGDTVGGDAAALEGRLKQLLKTLASEREILPIEDEEYIRVSRIAGLCAREEVLCSIEGLVRADEVSADLNIIFAHGHALHHQVQNALLASTGNLVGVWRCTYCGHEYGKMEGSAGEMASRSESLVPRPERCTKKCGNQEFVYVEQFIQNHEYKIQGHPDGFLRFDDITGLGILEVKSIGARGAWEVRGCPKIDHAIQAQCYMWLTGCKWAKILYWDKAGVGMSSFVEHTLEYDPDVVERVLELVTTIRDGIRKAKLPDRICTEIDCPRAKECPVAEACFANEEGAYDATLDAASNY